MDKSEIIRILKSYSCYECSYGCMNVLECHCADENCEYKKAIKFVIQYLEQEPKFIAKSDGTIEQIKNCDDCLFKKEWGKIGKLLSVILEKQTEQEPKTGHCKDCKWWKDKDGVYRRGINAESKCPINRREVMEGMGYCFMFEPQESEDDND